VNKKQFKKLNGKNKTFRKRMGEISEIFEKRLDEEIDKKVIMKVEKRFLSRLDAIMAERVNLLHK
jgi:hypothetical protein